jgi:uncharacterized protein YndB with AHSA1/START domain
MEDFDWTQFKRIMPIEAKMEVLYNAWTKTEEITKWFLESAHFFDEEGERLAATKNVQKDYSYEWSWFMYDIVEKGKILEANGKDHIKFTFAGDCIVDVNLSQLDNHVMVEITQSNIPTDDKSKKDIRLGCDSGWAFYLVNLKSVYEGGLDLRNKTLDLKGLINN